MVSPEPQPVPFARFRDELASYMDRCVKFGERITVAGDSQAGAVLVSRAEWDEITETLAILSDPDLLRQIMESERDFAAGRHRSAEDVFRELDAEP